MINLAYYLSEIAHHIRVDAHAEKEYEEAKEKYWDCWAFLCHCISVKAAYDNDVPVEGISYLAMCTAENNAEKAEERAEKAAKLEEVAGCTEKVLNWLCPKERTTTIVHTEHKQINEKDRTKTLAI